jgi:DHA1 family inner membrane transport protein
MLSDGSTSAGGDASPPAGTLSQFTRSEWILLLVLSSVQFNQVVDFVIMMPLGPMLQTALTLTTRQFAWIVSTYGFAAAITGFSAAGLLDRFDRKKALLLLLSGFAVGTFLCAAAPNFWVLLLGRAVAGSFAGIMGANVLSIVSDVFPESRRATAMGVVWSSNSIANIVGIPIGVGIAGWFGWRWPFTILAVLCLPALALAWRVLPPQRRHLERRAANPTRLIDVLLNPTHLRAYSVTMTMMIGSWTIIPFLSLYLVNNVGLPKSDMGFVWGCGGVATLLCMTPTGWIADNRDKLVVFRAIGIFCLVPVLLVTNLPEGSSLTATLLATTLFMVATSIRWVPLMAMITASAAPHQRGSFLSVNSSMQQLTMAVAPLLASVILRTDAEAETTEKLHRFPVVGVVSATAIIASIVLAGRLRRGAVPANQPKSEAKESGIVEPQLVPSRARSEAE